MMNFFFIIFSFLLFFTSCTTNKDNELENVSLIKTGAERPQIYLPLLQNKNVAIVTNQTGVLRLFDEQDSVIGRQHLVDFLLQKGISVKAIFAPEHGFRGKEDAGAKIKDGRDTRTGLPVYSLHGKHKKPQRQQLQNINMVIFDIQDVGVRFYTYISTLHYVMEACAENRIPLIVLDRPNPNGHYIDGAVMEDKYKSFLGMHAVPVVYGMTIGEYATMINGENWLPNQLKCDLKVVKLENWTHQTAYDLPIKPSPNLPNATAINLYPSLCFFEQTNVSVGRGTATPFQIYGSPYLDSIKYDFQFTPKPMQGAKYPKHKGKKCVGKNLQSHAPKLDKIELKWLIDAYQNTANKKEFFKKNLEYLTGTKTLREQIKNGRTPKEIRESWQKELRKFKKTRKKYLLYPDFQ